MDLYPRPGKNTHAFAMAIVLPHVDEKLQVLPEPKPDIRFLANLKQPVKWEDVSTVIHELGHAVHAAEGAPARWGFSAASARWRPKR